MNCKAPRRQSSGRTGTAKHPETAVAGATGRDPGWPSPPSAITLCDSSVSLKPVGWLHLAHHTDERLANQGVRTASPPGSAAPLPGTPVKSCGRRGRGAHDDVDRANQGPTQRLSAAAKDRVEAPCPTY